MKTPGSSLSNLGRRPSCQRTTCYLTYDITRSIFVRLTSAASWTVILPFAPGSGKGRSSNAVSGPSALKQGGTSIVQPQGRFHNFVFKTVEIRFVCNNHAFQSGLVFPAPSDNISFNKSIFFIRLSFLNSDLCLKLSVLASCCSRQQGGKHSATFQPWQPGPLLRNDGRQEPGAQQDSQRDSQRIHGARAQGGIQEVSSCLT